MYTKKCPDFTSSLTYHIRRIIRVIRILCVVILHQTPYTDKCYYTKIQKQSWNNHIQMWVLYNTEAFFLLFILKTLSAGIPSYVISVTSELIFLIYSQEKSRSRTYVCSSTEQNQMAPWHLILCLDFFKTQKHYSFSKIPSIYWLRVPCNWEPLETTRKTRFLCTHRKYSCALLPIRFYSIAIFTEFF